jgi:hypothetical protein
MKSFLKAVALVAVALTIGAKTNSCSISQTIQEKKDGALKTISKAQDLLEINAWTLTSRLNF